MLAWYVVEPVDNGRRIFPLVKRGFVSYSGVDVVEYLFAYTAYFAFCWVDESAGRIVLEVVFVVF